MYEIKTEKFSGPLDLLLQLVDNEKLEITEISIAQVTDQYIARLEKMPEKDPAELADFLVLAARLLLLKSRALLPTLEKEEEVDDLAKQLKLYKEFVDASKIIQKMINKGNFTFSRDRALVLPEVEFSPPEKLGLADFKNAFLAVLGRLEPLLKLTRQLIEKTISLQEKILSIKELLKKNRQVAFGALMRTARSKAEVIINFLALLELVKQAQIAIKQRGIFDEIIVERVC